MPTSTKLGSNNPFPSLLMVEQGSTPSTPAAGQARPFIRSSDGHFCVVDDAGNVTDIQAEMVGDSGSGGTKGLAPAPSAGDAAALKFLKADGTWAATPGGSTATRAITFAIDGGGAALTTGVKADVYVPYNCTITAVTMLADQSGSVVVDIWKDTYANYPPTVADTITASAKPTISSATKSTDSTLTGWTTSISAGDTLRFNIDSASTITRLVLTLTVTV